MRYNPFRMRTCNSTVIRENGFAFLLVAIVVPRLTCYTLSHRVYDVHSGSASDTLIQVNWNESTIFWTVDMYSL
jgi:hypothetical protein